MGRFSSQQIILKESKHGKFWNFSHLSYSETWLTMGPTDLRALWDRKKTWFYCWRRERVGVKKKENIQNKAQEHGLMGKPMRQSNWQTACEADCRCGVYGFQLTRPRWYISFSELVISLLLVSTLEGCSIFSSFFFSLEKYFYIT